LQSENSEDQSSRERFLEEQRKINEHKAVSKDPALNVSDEEVDSFENDMEEIDKNMGTEGYTVTKQEYEADKLDKAKQQALDAMQAFSRNGKLSNEQRATLQQIVAKRKTISDPILKHLLTQKAMQEQGFKELKIKVKDINEGIMNELMKASNDLLKTQGVIENLDDQILKYVDGNPVSV